MNCINKPHSFFNQSVFPDLAPSDLNRTLMSATKGFNKSFNLIFMLDFSFYECILSQHCDL